MRNPIIPSTITNSLKKAGDLFSDAWLTRESKIIRDTIDREIQFLQDIEFFEDHPDVRIIPLIETIAGSGKRKFLHWIDTVADALPHLVTPRRGISSIYEPTSISYPIRLEKLEHSTIRYPLMRQCDIYISVNVENYSKVNAAFPDFEENVVWSLHHEASHAQQLMRLTSNPISARSNILCALNDTETTAKIEWESKAWVALLAHEWPDTSHDGTESKASIQYWHKKWGEYYADIGATLMHARRGYSSQYLPQLCQARYDNGFEHDTSRVLKRLMPLLDFHPIVLNEHINSFSVHAAISDVIAPEIGYDLLYMISTDPGTAHFFETVLPPLADTPYTRTPEYIEMHQALGEAHPKLAMFFATLFEGPSVDTVQFYMNTAKTTPRFEADFAL